MIISCLFSLLVHHKQIRKHEDGDVMVMWCGGHLENMEPSIVHIVSITKEQERECIKLSTTAFVVVVVVVGHFQLSLTFHCTVQINPSKQTTRWRLFDNLKMGPLILLLVDTICGTIFICTYYPLVMTYNHFIWSAIWCVVMQCTVMYCTAIRVWMRWDEMRWDIGT